MKGELSFLIELQKHDAILDESREKVEAMDPLIQKKNQQIDKLKADLKGAKDALATHQVKKKQLEGEAEAKEKEVQKHQGELNSLKSNDAYKAMLAEIKTAKDDVVKIEDAILALMEEVEADDKRYKELEKKFKTDEAAVKAEIQNLESQKSAIQADLKSKQDARDEYAKTVPPPLLAQYNAIREKRGSLAIVPMVNNTCSGCRMGFTQAKANEIRGAKSMVLCDSCTRIIYLPVEETASTTPTTVA